MDVSSSSSRNIYEKIIIHLKCDSSGGEKSLLSGITVQNKVEKGADMSGMVLKGKSLRDSWKFNLRTNYSGYMDGKTV